MCVSVTCRPGRALRKQHPDLELLNLSNNAIQEVPAFYLALLSSKLTHLDLSRNALKQLPGDIGSLTALRVLNLSHNHLEALPDALCSLGGLQELLLRGNELTGLPKLVQQMTSLQVLDVSANKVEILPADLGWLPLRELRIQDNPKLRIPSDVQERGIRALMGYLQVVCEQHRLVDEHMTKFLTQGESPPDMAAPRTPEGQVVVEALQARLQWAARTGILDLRHCAIPEALHAARRLRAVYVFDARHNKWGSVPSSVMGMNELVVLNLSHNGIRAVDEGIIPVHLGVLDLSFNKVTSLPESLGKAPSIQQLYLANNRLTELPSTFASLPMVDLFLSENQFTSIPRAVLGMHQLAKLSMSCCKLVEVPPDLGRLTHLKFLDLSFNKISSLPEEMSSLQELSALNLSFNPLKQMPIVVPRLTTLVELNLDYTDISDMPADITQLQGLQGLQLEGLPLPQALRDLAVYEPLMILDILNTRLDKLDLSGTGLTVFPDLVESHSGLTHLDLSKNRIQHLPSALITRMTQLQVLDLTGNPLVPPYMQLLHTRGAAALLAFFRPTQVLDLSKALIPEVPIEVFSHCDVLQKLYMQHNQLTELPPAISGLTQLEELRVDHNKIRSLPMETAVLPKLHTLTVAFNLIHTLPDNLGSCTRLQHLDLQGNTIHTIPASLGDLSGLRMLNLASNRLTRELDPRVCQCSHLTLLDVSCNYLQSLPPAIGKLERLEVLNAAYNQLQALPGELRQLSLLQDVNFCDNRFVVEVDVVLAAKDAAGCARVLDVLLALRPCPKAGVTEPPAARVGSVTAVAAAPTAPDQDEPSVPSTRVTPTQPAQPAAAAELAASASPPLPAPAPDEPPIQAPEPEPVAQPAEEPTGVFVTSDISDTTKLDGVEQAGLAATRHVLDRSGWNRHLATVAKDPLRTTQRVGWGSIPLTDIPRIISALSQPPPPPPPAELEATLGALQPQAVDGAGPSVMQGATVAQGEAGPKRPQSRQRFKRLIDQGSLAWQLLGRMTEEAADGAAEHAPMPPSEQTAAGSGTTPHTEPVPPLAAPESNDR